jgi:hypothetical protein
MVPWYRANHRKRAHLKTPPSSLETKKYTLQRENMKCIAGFTYGFKELPVRLENLSLMDFVLEFCVIRNFENHKPSML